MRVAITPHPRRLGDQAVRAVVAVHPGLHEVAVLAHRGHVPQHILGSQPVAAASAGTVAVPRQARRAPVCAPPAAACCAPPLRPLRAACVTQLLECRFEGGALFLRGAHRAGASDPATIASTIASYSASVQPAKSIALVGHTATQAPQPEHSAGFTTARLPPSGTRAARRPRVRALDDAGAVPSQSVASTCATKGRARRGRSRAAPWPSRPRRTPRRPTP